MIAPELLKLRANPALSHWDDEDLRVLSTASQVVRYQQGKLLCEQGKAASSCWLLLDGQVEIFRRTAGLRITVARMGIGEIVGQLALIDGATRSASIEAATDVEALLLTRDIFAQLLHSHAPLALHFQRQIALASARQLLAGTEQLATTMGAVLRHGKLDATDLDYIRKRMSGIAPRRLRPLTGGRRTVVSPAPHMSDGAGGDESQQS